MARMKAVLLTHSMALFVDFLKVWLCFSAKLVPIFVKVYAFFASFVRRRLV